MNEEAFDALLLRSRTQVRRTRLLPAPALALPAAPPRTAPLPPRFEGAKCGGEAVGGGVGVGEDAWGVSGDGRAGAGFGGGQACPRGND